MPRPYWLLASAAAVLLTLLTNVLQGCGFGATEKDEGSLPKLEDSLEAKENIAVEIEDDRDIVRSGAGAHVGTEETHGNKTVVPIDLAAWIDELKFGFDVYFTTSDRLYKVLKHEDGMGFPCGGLAHADISCDGGDDRTTKWCNAAAAWQEGRKKGPVANTTVPSGSTSVPAGYRLKYVWKYAVATPSWASGQQVELCFTAKFNHQCLFHEWQSKQLCYKVKFPKHEEKKPSTSSAMALGAFVGVPVLGAWRFYQWRRSEAGQQRDVRVAGERSVELVERGTA